MSAAGRDRLSWPQMTDPDIGMVTNVRAAHLESFGSLDDIAAAKGELFAVMRDDATAVVNLDDAHVRVQAARHVGPRVTFGQHTGGRPAPGGDRTTVSSPARADLPLRGQDATGCSCSIGGAHSAFNALAALAAVVAAGGGTGRGARRRWSRSRPGPGRGKVHRLRRRMMLVDDSYNSSPPALASVLETLRLSEPPGRKVLVMGDMLELGRVEGALHREAGKRAAAGGSAAAVRRGPAVARGGGDGAARRRARGAPPRRLDQGGRVDRGVPQGRRPDRGQGLARHAHGARRARRWSPRIGEAD